VRTILRDIERLRARGITIETGQGRGGGIQLDPGQALPPARLGLEEVMALVVAVSLAQQDTLLPLGRPARSALHKLVATLPKPAAAELSRLLSRVFVGHPASSLVAATVSPVDDKVLGSFEQAFYGRRLLHFVYRDNRGHKSARHVEPHGLLLQTPAWYLLAFDTQKEAGRTFRMDRMARARVEDATFVPRSLRLFDDLLRDVKAAHTLRGRL
jgi:predicted DNA-binding transcriptional regulator YafY